MQLSERYVRPSLEPNDALCPKDAAPILRISRSAVYALMSVLERYVDPESGEVKPLPHEYRRLRDRAARAAWRRAHLVIIPEWGAESVGNSDWQLSRVRVTAWSHTDGWRIPALLATARGRQATDAASGDAATRCRDDAPAESAGARAGRRGRTKPGPRAA